MKKVIIKFSPALLIIFIMAVFFGRSQKSRDDLMNNRLMNTKITSNNLDFIILGDSRVMFSSNPDLINNKLKGMNFAFPTNSYSKYYLDQVESRIKPTGDIIMGLSLESFTGRSNNISMKNFITKFDRGYYVLNQMSIYLYSLFPSFDFHAVLNKTNPFTSFIRHRPRLNIAHENGWSEHTGDTIDESRFVYHYEKQFKSLPPKNEFISHLIKFVKKMKLTGAKVYFFESPISEETLAAEKRGYRLRDQFFLSLRRKLTSSGACFIHFKSSFKTYDGDHLTSSEAKRFSKTLGEKIKKEGCSKE
ncbi:MAG: hypothetical protein KC493_13010 [Bacteriovoracaceae bacterium]|nr:hypothetical protein [Bacteriovoracaceae bacterium]